MTARPDHPPLGCSGVVQRGRIEGGQHGDQLACRPDVLLREPVLADPRRAGVSRLDHQALRDGADTHGVARQPVDELKLHRVQAGKASGLGVAEHVIGHSWACYAAGPTLKQEDESDGLRAPTHDLQTALDAIHRTHKMAQARKRTARMAEALNDWVG
ncbi:hypothetical protein L1785_19025 [Antribacter sp. KLBMP9083]|uniref:Uncharacterized protein n=1 Tax=Antribacter soli TaxID=2910976 RepID=A0AA41QGJ5_9MICO|nr:hypothetical protein [Antribacter soli]MCF4123070.1 hypothetical protein [Antribacter soli]